MSLTYRLITNRNVTTRLCDQCDWLYYFIGSHTWNPYFIFLRFLPMKMKKSQNVRSLI